MGVSDLGPFLKATPRHYMRRSHINERAVFLYSTTDSIVTLNEPVMSSLAPGFGEFVLPGEFGDGGQE